MQDVADLLGLHNHQPTACSGHSAERGTDKAKRWRCYYTHKEERNMNETPWHMSYVAEPKPDTYAPGAIVTLITDGPDMAVIDHCAACSMVTVCWFDQNGYNEQVLPVEVLIDV